MNKTRIRPEVMRFAGWMEESLRANDYKGGWRGMKPWQILDRLREEMEELCLAWNSSHGTDDEKELRMPN